MTLALLGVSRGSERPGISGRRYEILRTSARAGVRSGQSVCRRQFSQMSLSIWRRNVREGKGTRADAGRRGDGHIPFLREFSLFPTCFCLVFGPRRGQMLVRVRPRDAVDALRGPFRQFSKSDYVPWKGHVFLFFSYFFFFFLMHEFLFNILFFMTFFICTYDFYSINFIFIFICFFIHIISLFFKKKSGRSFIFFQNYFNY